MPRKSPPENAIAMRVSVIHCTSDGFVSIDASGSDEFACFVISATTDFGIMTLSFCMNVTFGSAALFGEAGVENAAGCGGSGVIGVAIIGIGSKGGAGEAPDTIPTS